MNYKAIGDRLSVITEPEKKEYKKGLFYQYRYESGIRYLRLQKIGHYIFAAIIENIRVLLNPLPKHEPIHYDGQGNILRFEGPNFTSTYNRRNQLTSYRGKDGKWQNFEYNEAGKITRYEDNTYSFEYTYNEAGQPLTYKDSKDSKGNGWVKRYNDRGELVFMGEVTNMDYINQIKITKQ